MAPSTFTLDTTILPPDVLLLCDERFYELASKLAGPVEAKLLQVQGVRSVHSLLYIDDIFDILQYSCKELNDIKKNACLLLDNNKHIVKPGCKSNLKYFTQLLRLKNQEHLKTIGLQMKLKHLSNNNDSSISASQSSTQVLSTSQSSTQVLSTSQSSTQDTTTTTNQMNELQHRDFLKKTLNDWLLKNKENFNFFNEDLVEGKDYTITLLFNQASQEAFISCSCGVRINLTKERAHFSLSNYYKHIKTSRCKMVKNKRKIITDDINDDETESSQEEIPETDIVDISTTTGSTNYNNNNKQSHRSSKRRTNAGSHNVSSKRIRHH